jgi:Protein of unknown function (DUF2844)
MCSRRETRGRAAITIAAPVIAGFASRSPSLAAPIMSRKSDTEPVTGSAKIGTKWRNLARTTGKDDSMPALQSIANVKKCLLAGAVLAAALSPCIADAGLGQAETSVQTDAVRLKGSIKATQYIGYQVQEIQMPSGTLVREFVATNGTVFAVAWNGPAVPNLRQILGQYFDNFVAAAQAKHAGHHHLQIQQSDLVLQAGGHMRAFSGRAYLPQAVPAGVGIADLH